MIICTSCDQKHDGPKKTCTRCLERHKLKMRKYRALKKLKAAQNEHTGQVGQDQTITNV